MGARNNLSIRKAVTYYDCVPVTIDQQEYNYVGSDAVVRRTISFAFSRYELKSADAALISLLESENGSGFFSKLGDELKNKLQRQFQANNATQYINNLVNKAATFGKDLITGTAGQIVTNVSGTLQDKVDGAINNITGGIATAQQKAISTINDATTDAVNSITKFIAGNGGNHSTKVTTTDLVVAQSEKSNTNKGLSSGIASVGYVEKKTNGDDTPAYRREIVPLTVAKSTVYDTNVQIAQNDTPDYSSLPANKEISSDDNVTILTPISFKVMPNDLNDTRDPKSLYFDDKKTDPNDVIINKRLAYDDKKANSADTVDAKKIPYTIKYPDKNDTPAHI
jgi:hypothetical protein